MTCTNENVFQIGNYVRYDNQLYSVKGIIVDILYKDTVPDKNKINLYYGVTNSVTNSSDEDRLKSAYGEVSVDRVVVSKDDGSYVVIPLTEKCLKGSFLRLSGANTDYSVCITIKGKPKSGKSTLAYNLKKYLLNCGLDVDVVDEEFRNIYNKYEYINNLEEGNFNIGPILIKTEQAPRNYKAEI